jgi:hypothetical protein
MMHRPPLQRYCDEKREKHRERADQGGGGVAVIVEGHMVTKYSLWLRKFCAYSLSLFRGKGLSCRHEVQNQNIFPQKNLAPFFSFFKKYHKFSLSCVMGVV